MPDRGVREGVLLPELALIRGGGEGAVILIVGGMGEEEFGVLSIGETVQDIFITNKENFNIYFFVFQFSDVLIFVTIRSDWVAKKGLLKGFVRD